MNTTTEVTVPFLLADSYTDLYHKAQLATWEEDDRASSDPTWEEWF